VTRSEDLNLKYCLHVLTPAILNSSGKNNFQIERHEITKHEKPTATHYVLYIQSCHYIKMKL
jgi:hypothetical protein